jgi:branched-subunit amino acid ABC-type transport system permease component
VAWLIERLVLRHLVNQEAHHAADGHAGHHLLPRRLGQTIFGSDIYKIDVGMPKDPCSCWTTVFEGGVLVNKEDLYRRGIAAGWWLLLSLFFQKTKTGRALRAVADDHQAAQSIGIPLNRIWVIVWSRGGRGGAGGRHDLGQQAGRAVLAVAGGAEGLPVVILGGLTSVPGAIIGGLIIGVGEKLSEVYLGPMVGGGIEIWFAYVLALCFLLVRPQACSARRSSIASDRKRKPHVLRENGQFKTSYRADQQIFPIAAGPHGHLPAAGLRLRRGAAAGQRLPVPRHPDPVPDHVAGGAGAEHPGRLLRPDLAGHRAPSWRWAPMRPTTSSCASTACR